jgi:hypothetical protein
VNPGQGEAVIYSARQVEAGVLVKTLKVVPQKNLKLLGACLFALVLGSTSALPALAAEAAADAAQWSRTIGQSGLRRFYSTGADLGELINRQISAQIASRVETARRAQNPALPAAEAESGVDGFVAQYDSLLRVDTSLQRPFYLRALARSAKRFEPGKVHSRNDRYDVGALYATSSRSYLAAGLGIEQTRADLKYVTGNTHLEAYGPRLDGGIALRPWLALGLRAEQLQFSGDNRVAVRSATGTTTVTRDIDYRRRYVQLESIVRLTRAQWTALPAGWQAGGMAALHYLDTRYEPHRNSLGQVVTEPFGNHEHLGVLRTGVFLQGAFGANGAWAPYAEALVDREFDTNIDRPLAARNTFMLRTGIARTLGPGKRLSLEYQRSRSFNGERTRNNFILLAVLDF